MTMNQETANSPRMWQEEPPSDSILDSVPITPNRLPPPGGKKTLNHRLESNDSSKLSLRGNSALSPDGVQGMIEITGQLNDFLESLPSREKEKELLLKKANDLTTTNATSSFSRSTWPQKTHSSEGRAGSLDYIPSLPSRRPTVDDLEEKDIVIKISNEFEDASAEGSLDSIPSLPSRRPSIAKEKDINGFSREYDGNDFTPSLPSRSLSSHEEASYACNEDTIPSTREDGKTSSQLNKAKAKPTPNSDIREKILSRIPEHVKNLLSMEQWYRILEPIKGKRRDPFESSDSTGDWPMEKERISEDVSRPLLEESPGEAEDLWHPINNEPASTETQGGGELSEKSWIDVNTRMSYDALYSTEGESKKDTGDEIELVDDIEPSSFTLSTSLVKSKAHETEHETEGDTKELENGTSPLSSEEIAEARDESESSPVAPTSTRKKAERISFGNAHTRWHERILVSHPSTSSGPSIGIGWEYYKESEEPIAGDGSTGRGYCDFILSRRDREDILMDLGYSAREIASAVRENLKKKNERRRTYVNLKSNVVNVESVELVLERCNRKIRKMQKKFRVAR